MEKKEVTKATVIEFQAIVSSLSVENNELRLKCYALEEKCSLLQEDLKKGEDCLQILAKSHTQACFNVCTVIL